MGRFWTVCELRIVLTFLKSCKKKTNKHHEEEDGGGGGEDDNNKEGDRDHMSSTKPKII